MTSQGRHESLAWVHITSQGSKYLAWVNLIPGATEQPSMGRTIKMNKYEDKRSKERNIHVSHIQKKVYSHSLFLLYWFYCCCYYVWWISHEPYIPSTFFVLTPFGEFTLLAAGAGTSRPPQWAAGILLTFGELQLIRGYRVTAVHVFWCCKCYVKRGLARI